jgi:hypothetical protein
MSFFCSLTPKKKTQKKYATKEWEENGSFSLPSGFLVWKLKWVLVAGQWQLCGVFFIYIYIYISMFTHDKKI